MEDVRCRWLPITELEQDENIMKKNNYKADGTFYTITPGTEGADWCCPVSKM